MKRRNFIAAGLSAAFAGTLGVAPKAAMAAQGGKFKLKYAPGITAFSNLVGNNDPIENLKFIADQGFSAFFDNGLARRPESDKIMQEAGRLGLTAGPFVAASPGGRVGWVLDEDSAREAGVAMMKQSIDDAKRLGVQWILLVPGLMVPGMTMEQMTANVVKNLKHVSEKVDFAGKTIVLEPLNHRNHKDMFLVRIKQAMEICQAVGNPQIKIVNDLYHQQISEGDLIPNMDLAWDYIAAFHLGDTPGRKEPLTGEINYRNIFQHIHQKGYQGVLCMEHGKSLPGKEGDQRLLDAYRWCDAFDKPLV